VVLGGGRSKASQIDPRIEDIADKRDLPDPFREFPSSPDILLEERESGLQQESAGTFVRTRLGSRPRERWRVERVAMDLRKRVGRVCVA
jgi:hypothetical protein